MPPSIGAATAKTHQDDRYPVGGSSWRSCRETGRTREDHTEWKDHKDQRFKAFPTPNMSNDRDERPRGARFNQCLKAGPRKNNEAARRRIR